jgi:CO dehydrogenase/acetyl-CoA synthase beta subunit
MQLLESLISEVKEYMGRSREGGRLSEYIAMDVLPWPEAGPRDIVLKSDTGVELGNPKDESISFLLWSDDSSIINDGCISLIGPDISETQSPDLPFGKVILVSVDGFDEENSYDRYREMEFLRYDVSLKGYMMRAVSQHMREWSRVSREAVDNGFSFQMLGSALLQNLKALDYVNKAEVVFVTASSEEVRELRTPADRFTKYINAMTKMAEEMDFDCESCEYQEVCNEAEELQGMRKSLMKAKSREEE